VQADVTRPVIAPYVPAGQLVQETCPVVSPYVPAGQAEQNDDDASEIVPAAQLSVQAAVVRPVIAPYVPAGQAEQNDDEETE